MNPVVSIWSALDLRKRVVVIGATIAMFAAVLLLSRTALSPTMLLLYSNLDPAVAGGVVTALEQQGVSYQVRGDSIWVPQSDRDALRLTLAGQGLPAPSSQGYELLDGLSGFGTTSEMFDAAYWRAKEGELARTILANPRIRAARVHISAPVSRGFDRPSTPTAAVTVSTAGMSLTPPQILALRYLVASSVPGLIPESVSIIDSEAGLISGDDPTHSAATRAEVLRNNAERLVEARVGIGNAVVEVSIDEVTETETLTQRTLDPTTRVAISTDVTENTANAQNADTGAVTVASNLPTGDAGGGGTSQSQNSEARTLTNYEISETQRSLNRAPGGIRRMTVAVLVNDIIATDTQGNVTSTPRSSEELAALSELVAMTVGVDESRGDRISVRSMPFEPLRDAGSVALAPQNLSLTDLARAGILGAVALILGLFVVRPVLAGRRLPPTEPQRQLLAEAAQVTALAPPTEPQQKQDPVARVRDMIEARQTEALRVLQSWVEEPEVEA